MDIPDTFQSTELVSVDNLADLTPFRGFNHKHMA